MWVNYYWDLEEEDEWGDICNHIEANRLMDYDRLGIMPDGKRYVLVLVRDRDDECEGLVDRQYAYPVKGPDGKWVLPERFDNGLGAKVPARYHAELFKWQSE